MPDSDQNSPDPVALALLLIRAALSQMDVPARQALVMGFSDTFAVIGIVLVLAGIAILLTGKPKGAAAGGGH